MLSSKNPANIHTDLTGLHSQKTESLILIV